MKEKQEAFSSSYYSYITIMHVSKFLSPKNFLSVQVNSNGVLSFRRNFTSSTLTSLPISDAVLMAPFLSDIDLAFGGRIFYRFTLDPSSLSQVAMKINDAFSEEFFPVLVFIATWDRVTFTGAVNATTVSCFIKTVLGICS